MKTIISKAIKERLLIQFHYDGGLRTVEPHCFGLSTKGSLVVRGYQIQGYSSRGQLGWKLFDLDKVASLECLEQVFVNPRPGYKKGDKNMKSIFIEL